MVTAEPVMVIVATASSEQGGVLLAPRLGTNSFMPAAGWIFCVCEGSASASLIPSDD